MAEVDLHRERLQAIAEKRKRQAAIEDKRRQLEDKILQLQHLKSKSLREKWLMQGAPAGSSEEEEAKKKQCEEDEQTLKILEENVKRLEQDIGQLESEESLISAKEQILREKLKETAISFEDVQKSLSNQETDAVNYIYSQIPDLASFNLQNTETSLSGEGMARVAALYAMEINVEKDRNTGETKIVSASALDPEGVQQRGVKVYDDGNKVVYEVHHAGGVVENGIHKLSARDVDELIQKSQSNLKGGQEKECLPERTVTIEGNPSHVKEQMHFKEAKLELVHKSIKGVPVKHGQYDRSSENTGKDATLDQPITMIFMGYQNIDDEDETKKVLGYDDTIKAELVLIDEDDEKSLREKTVTDVSTMDGNAAELVSGKLLTETTEPSSPEGKEESLATEPIADVKKKTVQFKDPDDYEIEESLLQLNKPQVPEDDLNLKEKDQNSANFSDPARLVISKETMEIDVPVSEHKGIILINQDGSAHDQSVFLAVVANQNGIKNRHESIDSDVAQEIQYLDDVLEANCCDTSADNTMNGSPTPELCTVGESSSYVSVTAPSASIVIETIAEEPKQAPVVEITEASEVMDPVKMNGHSQNGNKDEPFEGYTYPASPNSSNSSRRSSKDGDILPKIIKKEAKFELRTFHEEKKPSKLFDDFNEKEHIRVRKVRPSEEVQELEKERLELIKSQAVKKNSGITTKWWNPPQEKTIEEQLDSDQLESHQKYKERKQKLQQQGGSPPAVKANHLPPVLSETTAVKKEDIVTEQIDFLAARKQFLNMENTNQPNYKPPPKRSVSANLFTVRPFYKSSEASKSYSCITVTNPSVPCVQSVQGETPLVKAERVNCISEDQPTMNQRLMADASPEPSADIDLQDEKVSKRSAEEFVSATASFTVLKDDDSDLSDRFVKSVSVSFLPEEQDSGLDDLSIKSQDTTVMETLSNYFSMDNISDSGASNETMSAQHDYSLGDLSQPQTPVNDTLNEYILEEGSKYDQGFYSPSSMLQDIDDQLDYHAGVLVQNVIEQALAEKAGFKDSTHSEDSDKSYYFDDNEPLTEKSEIQSCSSPPVSPGRDQREVFEPPQVSSPVQVTKAITIPKTFEGENVQLKQDNPLSTKSLSPTEQNCTEEHKQESYFSKYSQSAELRSTASILATQETEISVGPFKLRSKKQKTLSMIEEEIRAAQEREQDLKKQRERQSSQSQHSPSNKSAPVLPTRTVSYKTAPGKIEKIRNPSSPRGESFPIQPDVLLEEATGSQRPKNLMETLMDDFESHKTKRRDRMDDATVLDAVRVNRRKSALALKWEAGIYANRGDDDE